MEIGTVTLTLPLLVAGRDLAAAAVARLGDVAGLDVLVDARRLASGTTSFAAQLVQSILADAGAASMTLDGAPADFAADVRTAAEQLAVADRVRITSPAAPLAS